MAKRRTQRSVTKGLSPKMRPTANHLAHAQDVALRRKKGNKRGKL